MTDDSGTPGRAPWARLAPVYDWQLALERTALTAAAELAAIEPFELLLDVGTGTGGMLRRLAAVQSPHFASGIDTEPRMLRQAAQHSSSWPLVLADARWLPFLGESFHIVTASYVLHLLRPEAALQVLREAWRVLRPGGRIVTVTPHRPESRFGRWFMTPFVSLSEHWPHRLPGLVPMDPRPLLDAAEFEPLKSRTTGRGYPSLIVVARRPLAARGQSSHIRGRRVTRGARPGSRGTTTVPAARRQRLAPEQELALKPS